MANKTEPQRELARQVGADFGAALVVALAYIGDRLGLFKALAAGGARTSSELAAALKLNERYVREWLAAMAAAGYVDYEPQAAAFSLSPAQREVLLDDTSTLHMAGAFQYAVTCFRQVPRLMEVFRDGGGVPFADFGPEIAEAIRRMFQPGYESWVAQQWIPGLPDIHQRLMAGGAAAEVGCGSGQCLLPVAAAFSRSRFEGFDVDGPSIDSAQRKAVEAGLGERVTFSRVAAEDVPGQDRFDLVMAFNCIHDMTFPRRALRAIQRLLKPGGAMLWSEAKASDRLEDNLGPWGRLLYGASTMHCMTVSLAQGGEGLGVVIGPDKARDLAREAGFADFAELAVRNQFHRIFVLRK